MLRSKLGKALMSMLSNARLSSPGRLSTRVVSCSTSRNGGRSRPISTRLARPSIPAELSARSVRVMLPSSSMASDRTVPDTKIPGTMSK